MFTTDNKESRNIFRKPVKKVTKLGSKWNNGAYAGAFYWYLHNAASDRDRNISRQLVNARFNRGIFPGCFNIFSVFLNYPATGRNIKINLAVLVDFEN